MITRDRVPELNPGDVVAEHWILQCRLRDGVSGWVSHTSHVMSVGQMKEWLADLRHDMPHNDHRALRCVTTVSDL